MLDNKHSAVSPIVGVLIVLGLIIAVATLATLVVFDTSLRTTTTTSEPTIDVQYESEALIDITLIKGNEVVIEAVLDTEYILSKAGESVTIPNQEGDNIPAAYV